MSAYMVYQSPQTVAQYKAAGWGNLTNVGGAWSNLDDENPYIAQAVWSERVPPNLVKALINEESSGDWDRDNRVAIIRGSRMLPFVGIFEQTAKAWGYVFDTLIGNRQGQITAASHGLRVLSAGYGGYENAATVYFGGPSALDHVFVDEFGKRSDIYAGNVIENWHYLDAVGEGKTPSDPTPDGPGDGSGNSPGGTDSSRFGGFGGRLGAFLLGLILLGVGIWRVLD